MRTLPRWYGIAAATAFSLAFWALLFFAAYAALRNDGRAAACEQGEDAACEVAAP